MYSVEIPFVIIRPQFAEWGLISTRRVEIRTGRRVDVRTRIYASLEKKATTVASVAYPSEHLDAGGLAEIKLESLQADSKTTTVGIYDLSSKSIPELRGSRVKRAVGILLGSQVAVSQEMTLIPRIHRVGRKPRNSHKSVGNNDVGIVERALCH